ncbi:MAG: hypothetical protein EXS67_03645 [Candidatus Margulisbacteria bacterium]|nr:hypothetical protein [Candidatus Margulisiibacteriota bacterium]
MNAFFSRLSFRLHPYVSAFMWPTVSVEKVSQEGLSVESVLDASWHVHETSAPLLFSVLTYESRVIVMVPLGAVPAVLTSLQTQFPDAFVLDLDWYAYCLAHDTSAVLVAEGAYVIAYGGQGRFQAELDALGVPYCRLSAEEVSILSVSSDVKVYQLAPFSSVDLREVVSPVFFRSCLQVPPWIRDDVFFVALYYRLGFVEGVYETRFQIIDRFFTANFPSEHSSFFVLARRVFQAALGMIEEDRFFFSVQEGEQDLVEALISQGIVQFVWDGLYRFSHVYWMLYGVVASGLSWEFIAPRVGLKYWDVLLSFLVGSLSIDDGAQLVQKLSRLKGGFSDVLHREWFVAGQVFSEWRLLLGKDEDWPDWTKGFVATLVSFVEGKGPLSEQLHFLNLLGRLGDLALPALERACMSDDDAIRCVAAGAFRNYFSATRSDATMRLCVLLEDRVLPVSVASGLALAACADTEICSSLLMLLERLEGRRQRMVLWVLDQIGIGDQAHRIVSFLSSEDAGVRILALRVLRTSTREPAIEALLFRQVLDPVVEVSYAAICVLSGLYGRSIVGFLRDVLYEDTGDWEVRNQLCQSVLSGASLSVISAVALLFGAALDRPLFQTVFEKFSFCPSLEIEFLHVDNIVVEFEEDAVSGLDVSARRLAIRTLILSDFSHAKEVLLPLLGASEWDVSSDALEGLSHVGDIVVTVAGLQDIAMHFLDVFHEQSRLKEKAWGYLYRIAGHLDGLAVLGIN